MVKDMSFKWMILEFFNSVRFVFISISQKHIDILQQLNVFGLENN